MSPRRPVPGSVKAHHIWKRFRADRVKRQLKDRIRHVREHGLHTRYRWALRDVTLDIAPGESVGLIGPNGSGKSTLLKILADVMDPYAGTREIGGRVGAIIGVKAGIHPELTGRENVYLYGNMLGLSRRAVSQRFDDIVEFAELADAIDRQVKFYSSGMEMRLGFSVSAFLEPDLLIVDEVLAVGDATFQQRCLDRMRYVQAQGTTLIYVSHDLAGVENTCNRGVWLRSGRVEADGPIADVMGAYRHWIDEASSTLPPTGTEVEVVKAQASSGARTGPVETYGPLRIDLGLSSSRRRDAMVVLGVSEGPATPAVLLSQPLGLSDGVTSTRCEIAQLPLAAGRYVVWVGVFDGKRDLFPWHPVTAFDVTGPGLDRPPSGIVRLAPVHVDATWTQAVR